MIKGSNVYYYSRDGLGSVVNLTDNTGQLVESYTYDEYGNLTSAPSQIGNRYLYTGREYDPEIGLCYYRARYYDPSIGRFLQTDPIGYEGGINPYTYVKNNPVNWIDPFGLFRFGKRRLDGWPWIPGMSTNPRDDFFNTELSHEQGFFEDGSNENVGFGPKGRFSEDTSGKDYRYDNKHYDDDIMKEALKNLKDGKYSNWPWNKNNCQDWAERLRKEYERLKREREKSQSDSKGKGKK